MKKRKMRVVWVILYDDGSIHGSTFKKYEALDEVAELNRLKTHGRTFSVVKFIEADKGRRG